MRTDPLPFRILFFAHNPALFILTSSLLLAVSGCADPAATPESSATAELAMAAVLPAEAAAQASFIDGWRVSVSRPGGGVIADQTGAVGPEQTSISLQISVTLEEACENLTVRIELFSGGEVWFRSEESHEVCAGAQNTLQPQELDFVRPFPSIGPLTLPFNVEEGQSAEGSFRISYDGNDDLTWAASVQETAAAWLNLPVTSGSVTAGQAQDVAVEVDAADLAPGSYVAHVAVGGEGFPAPVGIVLVTLTVTEGPEIGLDRTVLSFTAVRGTNPQGGTFTVTNTGGGVLQWSASENAGWLSLSPSSGSLGAGQSRVVTASVTSAALNVGNYSASVTVQSPDADNSPRTVAVSLSVTPGPEIDLSPNALSFSASIGTNPSSRTLTVRNSGGGTLSWSATDNAGWLSLSPSSGSLGGGQSQGVTVSVNSAALNPGEYQAAITVSAANASNSPQVVAVTLVVAERPSIDLSLTSLSFSVLSGANPDGRTFRITNAGGGTLSWSVSDNASWMGVSPASGSLGGGQSQTVTVSVNSSDLAIGTYGGLITVSDPDALNSPRTITVSLVVQERAEIALDPTSLSFIATAGTNPLAQEIILTNSGGSALHWTTTTSAGWLGAPSSGTLGCLLPGACLSTNLQIWVVSESLSVGTYEGTVTFSDPEARNSPQTLSVTLTVIPLIGSPGGLSEGSAGGS